MSKSVCIIGAGPSGLVAAKTLLHDAPRGLKFDVTLFEAQPRIGGLWPAKKSDGAGLVHPLMIANQSRHTMYFSDFAWDDAMPQIPRAFQVGGYLERYRQRYCQNANINLGCRIDAAEQVLDESGGTNHKWKVRSKSVDGTVLEHIFDFLVIASGYFGKPAIPNSLKGQESGIPVVHSSKYRDLEQLLGSPKDKKGKILVVGGQLSGFEIAGTIATHLSSAINLPGPKRDAFIDPITQEPKFSIHHLIQRSTWVLPLTTCSTPTSQTPVFLPVDLNLLNLSNRGPGPLTDTQGHTSIEAARFVHSKFKGLLQTDQSEFSPQLAVAENQYDQQPFVGISDTYADFARVGTIQISYGKLTSISGKTAILQTSEGQIEDVAAVVLATGFEATSSLSFLSEEHQEKLSLDSSDLNNTVALALHSTHHPEIPNLGFVGFYRSPYWGAMEMQARVVTALFSHGGPTSTTLPPTLMDALKKDKSIERTLALRGDPRASQFPMGDYSWLMQEFGIALGIERVPPISKMPELGGVEMNILTTARYPGNYLTEDQKREVEKNLKQTEELVYNGINNGRLVARAIFRSLLGEWKLERDLISRKTEQPTGKFTGTAKFYLREGTAEGREAEFAEIEKMEGDHGFEYLYIENGEFVDEQKGVQFNATRRYIWRYDERRDRLSVWFVKTDDDRTADYLFHDIELIQPEERELADGWRAKGSHLCIQDQYEVQYKFLFQSVNLKEWKLGYTVNGPKKDYSIDSTYTR